MHSVVASCVDESQDFFRQSDREESDPAVAMGGQIFVPSRQPIRKLYLPAVSAIGQLAIRESSRWRTTLRSTCDAQWVFKQQVKAQNVEDRGAFH